MTTLFLSAQARDDLARLARAAHPREACGLLIGRQDEDTVHVREVLAARNLEPVRPHDRYELDPAALLHAETSAHSRGLDVVGIWHSHPDRPACPSQTDRRAAWPGWSYVIVSVAARGEALVRSWRLHNNTFREERIHIGAPASGGGQDLAQDPEVVGGVHVGEA